MRWPSRNGLAIPVEELGYTIVPHEKGRTTNHHENWPKRNFQEIRYKQVFRNLVSQVVTLPIEQHQNLHDDYNPPIMPKDTQMIEVVDEYLATYGVINCVREAKTNQVYQIQPEQWQLIRGLYRSGYATAS